MKTVWFLVFRVFLVIALLSSYLLFLYGQERDRYIPIGRNAARSDLVDQSALSVDDPAHDTLGNKVILTRNFLREHQNEVSVGIYDLTVFRAIHQARVRLQKADSQLSRERARARFKVPDKEFYEFFQCGSHVEDCWEGYLRERDRR